MGRKPQQLISENFERGAKLPNNSNRYEHTCLHCKKHFAKGRQEALQRHLATCHALSAEQRARIRDQLFPENVTNTAAAKYGAPPPPVPPPPPVTNTTPVKVDDEYRLRTLADASQQVGSVAHYHLDGSCDAGPIDPQLMAVPAHDGTGHPVDSPTTPVDDFANENQDLDPSLDVAFTHPSLYHGMNVTASTSTLEVPGYADLATRVLGMGNDQSHYDSDVSMQDTFNPRHSQYAHPHSWSQATPIQPERALAMPVVSQSPPAGHMFTPYIPPMGYSTPGDMMTSHAMQLPPGLVPHSAQHSSTTNSEQLMRDSPTTSVSGPIRTHKKASKQSAEQRGRQADMRKVGSCLRCSRLNKVCNTQKPCKGCEDRKAQKEWIGPCTTLNKGQDFNLWFGDIFARRHRDNFDHVLLQSASVSSTGYVEYDMLGVDGEKLLLNVEHLSADVDNDDTATTTTTVVVWSIGEKDLPAMIQRHVKKNIDTLISTIQPATVRHIIATAREIAKPARDMQDNENDNDNDNENQNDEVDYGPAVLKGDKILELLVIMWLYIYIMPHVHVARPLVAVDANRNELNDVIDTASHEFMMGQILAALDANINECKVGRLHATHKLDSSLGEQTKKHWFNLLLSVLVVLSAVEGYRALLDGATGHEAEVQAQVLGEKYQYTVRNIKLLPRLRAGVFLEPVADDGRDKERDHGPARAFVNSWALSGDEVDRMLRRELEQGWLWARPLADAAAQD